MSKDFDKLIYLDSSFVSSKYEEIRKVSPTVQITKVEGMKAQVGIGLFSSDIHTQETKTFKISSLKMYGEIKDELLNYPDSSLSLFQNYTGTTLVWIEGNLSLGTWRESSSSQKQENEVFQYFEIYCQDKRVALLTHNEYLSSGFDSILSSSKVFQSNISIPVRSLVRLMWHVEDAENYVACPYVITER